MTDPPVAVKVESTKDWRGNVYSVGDVVLYPRMSDRSCEMQEGVVLEIREWPVERRRRIAGESRWETYTATQTKVRIQPTISSRFGRWSSAPRPVWIQLGENVTAASGG